MSGTTPRRRHGLAGLLVILFVVGGLIFSYGLGHAPVARVCTEHAVSAPLGALPAPGTPPSWSTPSSAGAVSPVGAGSLMGTGSLMGAVSSMGSVSVLSAVAAPGVQQASRAGVSPLQGLLEPAGAALTAPPKRNAPDLPLNTCLCLAVLLLVLLGLATGLGRPAFRLPARVGWAVVLPPGGTPSRVPRHSLQVLRL